MQATAKAIQAAVHNMLLFFSPCMQLRNALAKSEIRLSKVRLTRMIFMRIIYEQSILTVEAKLVTMIYDYYSVSCAVLQSLLFATD